MEIQLFAGSHCLSTSREGNYPSIASVKVADNITLPVLTKEIGGFHAQKVLIVDGSGTIITSFGSGQQYDEDSAGAGGEKLTLAGVVRRDTPSSGVSADGDLACLSVNSSGRLYVSCDLAADAATETTLNAIGALLASGIALPPGAATETTLSSIDTKITACNTGAVTISAALPAGTNAIGKLAANSGVVIGAVELAASQTLDTVTTVSTLTGSGVAHDAADSGNPHKIGAKAKSALSGITRVAANDRTDLYSDLDGALVTRSECTIADHISGNASNTDGASTTCIVAQGAGIKTVLTDIILTNTHATDFAFVEIKDGSTTKLTIPVPPKGGAIINLTKGIVGTVDTAWNFDPSAATTAIYCSMSGYKVAG